MARRHVFGALRGGEAHLVRPGKPETCLFGARNPPPPGPRERICSLAAPKQFFCANFDPHAYGPPIVTARRGPSFSELYQPWFSRGPYTDKNPFSAIADTEQTLQKVFNRNILPGKYRNLSATAFIASFMGASNYDLNFAIERYDKDIDQVIAREIKKGTS